MKHIYYILISAIAVLILSSCSKEVNSNEKVVHNYVNVSLTASYPETKVTLGEDNATLEWEGTESIGLWFGKVEKDTLVKLECEIPSIPGQPGKFSGTIDFGATGLTITDIQAAVVLPYHPTRDLIYRNEKIELQTYIGAILDSTATLTTLIQRQDNDAKLNQRYLPLFAPLSASDVTIEGDTYKLNSVQLQWGCSAIRFLVHGKHADGLDGEKLTRITLRPATEKAGSDSPAHPNRPNKKAYVGYTYYSISDSKWVCSGRYSSAGRSDFNNPPVIPSAKVDAVQLYMFLLPRDEDKSVCRFGRVEVYTDKATYKKDFGDGERYLQPVRGRIYPIVLNLGDGNYTRTAE